MVVVFLREGESFAPQLLRDGESSYWMFEERHAPPDDLSGKHTHVLNGVVDCRPAKKQRMTSLSESVRQPRMQSLDESVLVGISDQLHLAPDSQLSLSFGQTFYRLSREVSEPQSWPELQFIDQNGVCQSFWSSVLDENFPLMSGFIQDSVQNQQTRAAGLHVLHVRLSDTLCKRSYSINFQWDADLRMWELRADETHGSLQPLATVVVSDGLEFQVRVSYPPVSEREQDEARHVAMLALVIHVPSDDEDVFSTRVSLSPDTAGYLKLEQAQVLRQFLVRLDDLVFTYSELDACGLLRRLDCQRERSSPSNKEEFMALVKHTLRLLHAPLEVPVLDLDQDEPQPQPQEQQLPQTQQLQQPPLEHPECVVCFERETQTVLCARVHAVCLGCFDKHIDAYLDKPLGQLKLSGVRPGCPVPDCGEVYPQRTMLLHVSETVTGKLLDTVRKIGELEGVQSVKEQAFVSLRTRIEDAMNLRCPGCSAAFLDYSNCDAVQCSSCPAFFCGLCLHPAKDSQEAHAHAAKCDSKKKASYFSSQQLKEQMHRDVKTRQLKAVIHSLTADEKELVRKEFAAVFQAAQLNVLV